MTEPDSCCWFDPETRSVLQEINHAWKSKAGLSEYTRLRDTLLNNHDRLDVQTQALASVVGLIRSRSSSFSSTPCSNDELEDAAAWDDFFALAAKPNTTTSDDEGSRQIARKGHRSRVYNDISRTRNLAIVVALWSHEVVRYYGWHTVGQGQLKVIRACAEHFPDFDSDLIPRLNNVLFHRHRSAILQGKGKTLNDAPLQPYKDLNIDNLSSASDLSHDEGDDMQHWLTKTDGNVMLSPGGTTLKAVRPEHFHLYLLSRDRFGLIVAKGMERDLPSRISPPATSTYSDGTTDEWIEEMLRGNATSPIQSHLQTPLQSTEPYVQQFDFGVHSFDDAIPDVTSLAPPPFELSQGQMTWIQAPTTPGLGVEETNSLFLANDWLDPSSPVVSLSSPAHIQSRSSTEPPDSALQSAQSLPTELTPASSPNSHMSLSQRKRSSPSAAFQPRQRRARLVTSAIEPDDSDTILYARGASATRTHSTSPSATYAESYPEPLLVCSPSPANNGGNLTIEQSLQNRYRSDISQYVSRVQKCKEPGRRAVRALWMSCKTQWAKIWTPCGELGSGSASSQDDAETLYYTAAEMVAQSQAGTAFRRPVVIKESFTDRGMHSVSQFLAHIEDMSSPVEVRRLDSKHIGCVGADELTQLATTESCRLADDGFNILALGNRTKSHRPLFTLLPRFRLLETLSEGLKDPAGACSGTPQAIDTSVGFNILGLPGAFIGAHVNTLCGFWLRNLEGVAYVTIALVDGNDWDSFVRKGEDWDPRGKQRLIVLEQDDVLFFPPGVSTVHTIHCQRSCLMEGAIVWDTLNVPGILRSLLFSCANPLTVVKEALAFPVPRILESLNQLVRAQPNRFRGARDSIEFLNAVEKTINALLEWYSDHSLYTTQI